MDAVATEPPETRDAAERLLAAVVRLASVEGRALDATALRAAVPLPEPGAELAGLVRGLQRLAVPVATEAATVRRLRRCPTPCLLLGREVGVTWLLRSRAAGRLVLAAEDGTSLTATPQRAASFVVTILTLPATAIRETPGGSGWRALFLDRLRPVVWEVAVASVAINLVALATPVFMLTVYNKVINHGAVTTLDVMTIGMVTLVGFELVLRSLRGYVASHTAARLEAALGSEVVHRLLHLPYRRLEAMSSGQMMERLRQLDQLRQFFAGQMPLVLVDLAFVTVFVAALCWLSPVLGTITAGSLPLFVLLSAVANRRQRAANAANHEAQAAKASLIGESAANALTIKALALEADIERRFDRRLAESAAAGFRAGHLASLVAGAGQGLQHLVALTLVYVGAHLILAGQLSIGALVASTILSSRAVAPMRQLFGAWRDLQAARDAFRRLDELMTEDPPASASGQAGEVRITGRLRFEQVSFRYRPDRDLALDDVSFELSPGSILGLIGPPGSGKSTLVRLLAGLDTGEHGRIVVDDHDLSRLPPAILKTQIAVVPQEIQLFAGTIAENIALGAVDRVHARIAAAARFAGVHDAIERLPNGYATVLGERGGGLSSGQRQLLAVARALMRNPTLLVLDEATSALDAASEAHVLGGLRRASRGRAILLVTHRLSALAFCDRIAVLQVGRLVRIGPAAEVLASPLHAMPGASLELAS